jgi:hypothetical protein
MIPRLAEHQIELYRRCLTSSWVASPRDLVEDFCPQIPLGQILLPASAILQVPGAVHKL